jgi:hypothetical protein
VEVASQGARPGQPGVVNGGDGMAGLVGTGGGREGWHVGPSC